MPSGRVIVVACYSAVACLAFTARDAYAQACAINSPASGPLSCAVTTTVTMTVRVPTMVGVSVTPGATLGVVGGKGPEAGSVVEAGIGVRANRSYTLQIARAPIDSGSGIATSAPVTWASGNSRAVLGDAPIRIDQHGSATAADRPATRLALSRGPQRVPGPGTVHPIGLALTVVAP